MNQCWTVDVTSRSISTQCQARYHIGVQAHTCVYTAGSHCMADAEVSLKRAQLTKIAVFQPTIAVLW